MSALRLPSRSLNYGSGNPDVVLVTSDDVHFFVHRKNLSDISSVFENMFKAGTPSVDGQLPHIELAESSEVVQALLAESHAYPVLIPRFELEFSKTWELVKAAEQYQVTQALSAIKAALSLRMSRESPPNAEHDLQALVFSLHCHFSDLEDLALRRILEEEITVDRVERWLTSIEAHFPVDDRDRLLELIRQHHERASVIRLRLRQNLSNSIAAWHRTPLSGGKPICSCPWTDQALQHWDGSNGHISLDQLKQYVEEAKAELDELSRSAEEGSGECVAETSRKLEELVKELEELSERIRR